MSHPIKTFPHSDYGFTFIELIVVTSIILLFSGLSVRGYITSSRIKTMQRDAEIFVSRLELAKEYTLTRNVHETNCDLLGYAVLMPVNGNMYQLVRRCRGPGGITISTPLEDFDLTPSIIASVNPMPQEVYFQYPLGTSSANKTVVIRNPRISRCVTINVSTITPITTTTPYAC